MDDRDLSILVGISNELCAGADLFRGLRQITASALHLVKAEHASLRLCDEQRGELLPVARAGVGVDKPPPTFRRGEGLMGWVARTGRSARVADCARDPRFRPVPERGYAVGSLLSLPLHTDGRVLGVLSFSSPHRAAFDVHDEQLGRLLAHSAAQALRLAELERQVITDAHTGTYNRRHLRPRLDEELARARRTDEPLSVMLLDLDHFKRVNDGFGHAVGDEVLRAFVEIVKRCVRSVDIVVRRGGDEFVLIMPATSTPEACRAAERIRGQLMVKKVWGERQVSFSQTVSVGVATWDGLEDAEALESRADAAMYEAKGRGRNRVVAAERRGRARRDQRQLDLWARPASS